MTDDTTYSEIQQIKSELTVQGGILRALLHAQGTSLADNIVEEMQRDNALAQVFLAVDGVRTQKEIVDLLRAAGIRGSSQPNVSAKMNHLFDDLGLIAPTVRVRTGVIYRRTPVADALKIRQRLESIGFRAAVSPSGQDTGSDGNSR